MCYFSAEDWQNVDADLAALDEEEEEEENSGERQSLRKRKTKEVTGAIFLKDKCSEELDLHLPRAPSGPFYLLVKNLTPTLLKSFIGQKGREPGLWPSFDNPLSSFSMRRISIFKGNLYH